MDKISIAMFCTFFRRDLLYVCPQYRIESDIHKVSPYKKSNGRRCHRHQIGVASHTAVPEVRRNGWEGGDGNGRAVGTQQYAVFVAYLKAGLFLCIFLPAISPYLWHGCMAGYSYHAPLGHSHFTRAYEKAQISCPSCLGCR